MSKTISTNFESVTQGTTSNPNTYNTNLSKIEGYLNEVLAYLEQFMTDMTGEGVGVVEGGELSIGTGLTVDASAVVAWVGGERITGGAATVSIPANSISYIYLNADGEYEVSNTFSYSATKIPRGKATTDGSTVTTLVAYNNVVFTMQEMALNRIAPVGLSFVQSGGNTIINVSYIDPATTGLESIVIEGSTDNGETWSELATVTP